MGAAEGSAATRAVVAGDVRWILERERVNGGPFWSRADRNIHAPAGFSTLLVLNVLGELGATRLAHPLIADAAEFVFGYQCDDGAFRYTPGSSKLDCIAGQALAGLGRIGAAGGERAEAGFQWLLDSQRDDGGWRCPMVRLGDSAQTDASNPGATIFVLDAFRFRRNSPADEATLRSGVNSLLRHWETRVPLGPCRFGIGNRFLAVEYPFWRYNLFYYVYVLAHYKQARADTRFTEAVRQLSAHVNAAGEMVLDAPPRAWQGRSFARKDAPSELATRRWQQIRALLSQDSAP